MALDKKAVLTEIDAAHEQRVKLYSEVRAKGYSGLATAKLVLLATLYGDTIKHLDPPEGQHLASLERAYQRPINSDRDRKEQLDELEGILAALRTGYENGSISTGRFANLAILSALHRLENILNRFGKVARQLARRQRNRAALTVADEYDVQDLLHALLLIEFDDVREEDPAPKHSGGSSRIDFVLKKERIVLEVKMTRAGLTDKEVGAQLILDGTRYRAHPDCELFVCFVYDPGHHIKNSTAIKQDIETSHASDPKTVVIIRQD